MVEVVAERMPAVMCGHWPGFYYNGEEYGFNVLKTVKKRLDEHYDDLIWMKVSEITDYWCAKELATLEAKCFAHPLRIKFGFKTQGLRDDRGHAASGWTDVARRLGGVVRIKSQNVAGPLADNLPIPIGQGLFPFVQEPFDLTF